MSSGEFLFGRGAPFTTSKGLTASATTQSHTAITFLQPGFLPLLVVLSVGFRVTDSFSRCVRSAAEAAGHRADKGGERVDFPRRGVHRSLQHKPVDGLHAWLGPSWIHHRQYGSCRKSTIRLASKYVCRAPAARGDLQNWRGPRLSRKTRGKRA